MDFETWSFLIYFLVFFFVFICLLINRHLTEKNEKKHELDAIAALTVVAIKCGKKNGLKKLDAVKDYLRRNINDEDFSVTLQSMKNFYKRENITINYHCLTLRRQLDYNQICSLFSLMFEVCSMEGVIDQETVNFLNKVARHLLIEEVVKKRLWNVYNKYIYKDEKINIPVNLVTELEKALKTLGSSKEETKEEIRKKYLAICMEHHPDKYEQCDVSTKTKHEEIMKEITAAWQIVQKSM